MNEPEVKHIRKILYNKTSECIKKKMSIINCHESDISIIPENIKYCIEEWVAFENALSKIRETSIKYQDPFK